jgi:hypothetical protein
MMVRVSPTPVCSSGCGWNNRNVAAYVLCVEDGPRIEGSCPAMNDGPHRVGAGKAVNNLKRWEAIVDG